jgi:pseudaminic acid synthase
MDTATHSIKLAELAIGPTHRPFIIAEMSGNHNRSLERALAIVEAAAKAGAHGLKIQTFTADSMTLDLDRDEFSIRDPSSIWSGTSLYKLYSQACTPYEWHAPIFARARQLGMVPFSTPFDSAGIDFLETLDPACYKIASFENIDLPLIGKAAATGKPLVISTGMATVAELDEMVRTARESGCRDLILLKCTSTYPATPENSNVATIPHMRALFGCQIGLSDHTSGLGAAVAAVALGATVIEKHLTLGRADGGVDSAFSLEPTELAALVVETERAWQSLGQIQYGPLEAEKKSLVFRRSLYVVTDMEAGDVLSHANLRAIRPGLGLPPKYLATLIGKRVRSRVARGTPMTWDLLE